MVPRPIDQRVLVDPADPGRVRAKARLDADNAQRDLTRKQASGSKVKGFVPYRIPRMWNVRIED